MRIRTVACGRLHGVVRSSQRQVVDLIALVSVQISGMVWPFDSPLIMRIKLEQFKYSPRWGIHTNSLQQKVVTKVSTFVSHFLAPDEQRPKILAVGRKCPLCNGTRARPTDRKEPSRQILTHTMGLCASAEVRVYCTKSSSPATPAEARDI